MQIKKLYSNVSQVRNFFRTTGVKPVYFVLPIILSFGTALFDGLSIGLLVPLARGVIGMDFSFVRDLPVFKSIVYSFPGVFIHTKNPDSSIFILLLGIIFISTIMKNILFYFSSLTSSYQARQLCRSIRQVIFSRYLSFGKLFFDRTNMGRLNTILIHFTQGLGLLVDHFRDLIRNIFTIIVYIVIMFIISWKLAFFAMLLFPALYYSMNWIIERIKTTSKISADSEINQAWQLFDVLSCLPLVKSYAREKEEKEHFSELSNSVAQFEFSIDKKILLISPIQELIIIITLLFIISIVAFMLAKGYAGTISSFLVFVYVLRRCVPIFNGLNNFRAYFAKMEGPIRSILQILDDEDKFFIPQGNKEFTSLNSKIELKRLTFSYIKNIKVLKDISFSIEKGKMTAMVGPTGSGKTTLVNLILRFYDSPPSTILIDGTDIRNFTLKSLMNYIALVSQDTLLFNNTIRYNITYGVDKKISNETLVEVAKKSRLYDFVTALPDKFETVIGDRGVKLSGGEKQRLSIARALLKESGILILDEATSSLDSKTERLIQEAINEVIKDKTAIVIAHRLSTIKHADKIIVIENGRLVEEGPLDELLYKKGKFYEYWQEQKFD